MSQRSEHACDEVDCTCQPLRTVRTGDWVYVRHLTGDPPLIQRLREMGFYEQAEVRVVCAGGAVIAQVHGSKVCLSHGLAGAILVAPLP
jgi:Fe2+ transport system protein FeoA